VKRDSNCIEGTGGWQKITQRRPGPPEKSGEARGNRRGRSKEVKKKSNIKRGNWSELQSNKTAGQSVKKKTPGIKRIPGGKVEILLKVWVRNGPGPTTQESSRRDA